MLGLPTLVGVSGGLWAGALFGAFLVVVSRGSPGPLLAGLALVGLCTATASHLVPEHIGP